MDAISKDLFNFFFDLENILRDEYDTSSSLAIFKFKCQQYLFDRKYPNINIQDEQGNTFLHYAMESGKLSYCYELLNLGSNPYLINHEGRNAFQIKKKYYNFISDFWKYYENLSVHEFNKQALLYHSDFRQSVFDIVINKQFIKIPFNKIESYLNQIKLYSIINHVNLLFSVYQPEFTFALFQQHYICQQDSKAHSLFLSKFYPLTFEFSHQTAQLAQFHHYLKNTLFNFDDNIKKLLESFQNDTKITNFHKDNFTILFNNILNSSQKELLVEFFHNKHSELAQFFTYIYLQNSLKDRSIKTRNKI